MVFKCNNHRCGELWFVQRTYDSPRNNRCPNCGQIHYLHQHISIGELEKIVNEFKQNHDEIDQYKMKYLELVLTLETMVATMIELSS